MFNLNSKLKFPSTFFANMFLSFQVWGSLVNDMSEILAPGNSGSLPPVRTGSDGFETGSDGFETGSRRVRDGFETNSRRV